MDVRGAPSFSVVIAAYNSAHVIGDAIRSALEQDPPPLEVIVGDDGSTDDLAGALEPFAGSVRVVRIEHRGEAAAKNAAATEARGDFIAFLDADDLYLPGRLRAIAELATEQPNLDVLTTDAHLVHDGTVLGQCYGPNNRFAHTDQRTAILRGNFVFGLAAVRRSRFVEVGGFDPEVEYTTDWDLWIRLVFTGSTIGLVDRPLAEYRLHESSMSARRASMFRGRLTTLRHAAARVDLTDDERLALETSRRRCEAALARAELRDALLSGARRAARSAAVRVARDRGFTRAVRVKALATAIAPSTAGRRLRAREQGTFLTVGDRRLPRVTHGAGRAGAHR